MTQQEKQIKIAEKCGWTDCMLSCGVYLMGTPPYWGDTGSRYHPIPDYFSDLNATHEMEKVMTHEQLTKYYQLLWANAPLTKSYILYAVTATASERANAFGLTMQLWKEGE